LLFLYTDNMQQEKFLGNEVQHTAANMVFMRQHRQTLRKTIKRL
jgi:hypothetical protein